ncbi:MAG: serpin family protein [Oscillospiraceae bacterium]|nr:serpin family protein [Oscillospiraceae bacterium]
MKKRIISAVAALLTITMTAGCTAREDDYNAPGDGMVIGKVEHTALNPIEVTDNNVLNSIRVFDLVSADKANSMFSPLSLNMALGMLAEGAEGSSKEALDKYLGTDDYGAFAESYMKTVKEKYNVDTGYKGEYSNALEIANSFWADKGFPFKSAYKHSLTQKFGAEVRNLDFGNKNETLKEINGWVNDKTHKMIPSIISNYSEDLTAVLINTVYFESGWSNDWYYNENNNKDAFTLLDGTSKELTLMRNGGNQYFENDRATAFGFGYRNGLEFIGILPKETGDFTIESLDIPSLLASETYDYDVSAQMPRLTFDTSLPLMEALSAAGLSELFGFGTADLSGISDESLFVSEVLQKTRLELDENGTRAAAVTEVFLADGAAMPVEREIKEVYLNRPFAFVIYDSAEDQIVFLGKVTEP